MPSIILQFCAFKSFFGSIIDWGTEGEVGHVDAILANGDLFGAQHQTGLGGKPSGVWPRPASYVRSCGGYNLIRVEIPVTVQQEDDFYEFLFKQEGKPYDTKGILGFLAGRNWREPDSWFCSELQAAALEVSGVFPHRLYVWKNRVTPQELLLVTSTLGKVHKA